MRPRKGGAPGFVLVRAVALLLFFFEDEVGGGGVGGDFDLMGDAGGDVDDVSGVEDGFLAAFDGGAEGFAGSGGAVGVFALHGAAGDESDGAGFDEDLVDPEFMALGVAAVDAHDQEGAGIAVVVGGVDAQAARGGFGGGEKFGFALALVGSGVDGGLRGLVGLGDGWGRCDEDEGQDDATGHAGSLWMGRIVLGGLGMADPRFTSHPWR
jgi:hypothetical protein